MKPVGRRAALPGRQLGPGIPGKFRARSDSADAPVVADLLREGAQRLGCMLEDAQSDRLLTYLALLSKWNGVYNLTAIREPSRMIPTHVLDCLAALHELDEACGLAVPPHAGETRTIEVLDVGSGAGLPGLVWAAMDSSAEHDALPARRRYTLIDAVEKKTAFQRQAAGELGLQAVSCIHGRVETWRGGPFHVVTSRAYASLAQFVAQTEHLLAAEGCWLAMKGAVPHDEIAGLPAHVVLERVATLDVPGLDGAARCVVRLRRR